MPGLKNYTNERTDNMAIFNPDFDSATPDFTRSSKGIDADRSLGTLFSGAGDIFTLANKGADDYYKNAEREQATAAVDEVQDRLTGNAAPPLPTADSDAPNPIDRRAQRLRNLAEARRQGKFTDSYYWMSLDAEARNLRAQFPGDRERIDNIMQDLTGHVPANALISALAHEAKDGAGKGEALQNHWVNETINKAPEQWAAWQQQGKTPSIPEMQNAVAQQNIMTNRIARSKAVMETQNLSRTGTQHAAQDTFHLEMEHAYQKAFTTTSLGEFSKRMDADLTNHKNGAPWKPEELQALTASFNQVESQMDKTFNSILQTKIKVGDKETTYDAVMSPEQKASERSAFMSRISRFKEAIINKDYGVVKSLANANQLIVDGDINTILLTDKHARRLLAMKHFIPDTVAPLVHGRPDMQTADMNFARDLHLSAITTGEQPIRDSLADAQKNLRMSGDDRAKVNKETIKATVDILLHPDTKGELAQNVVTSLYGPANQDFMTDVDPSQRHDVLTRLTSPAISKKMLELKNNGQEGLYNQYVDTVKKWTTILTGPDIEDVTKQVIQRDGSIGLSYDATKHAFVAVPRERQDKTPINSPFNVDDVDHTLVQSLASRLNKDISGMVSLWKQEGKSADEINLGISNAFAAYGVNVNDMGYKPVGKTGDLIKDVENAGQGGNAKARKALGMPMKLGGPIDAEVNAPTGEFSYQDKTFNQMKREIDAAIASGDRNKAEALTKTYKDQFDMLLNQQQEKANQPTIKTPKKFNVVPMRAGLNMANLDSFLGDVGNTDEQGKSVIPSYAKPEPKGGYLTKLNDKDEAAFQQWVKENKIPFDPSPKADYDMRGFWKGLTSGDPNARQALNANDGQMHFSDYWKTPYHQSFSAESKWAGKGAPTWNDQDQLVLPDGKVVFDERNGGKIVADYSGNPDAEEADAKAREERGEFFGKYSQEKLDKVLSDIKTLKAKKDTMDPVEFATQIMDLVDQQMQLTDRKISSVTNARIK